MLPPDQHTICKATCFTQGREQTSDEVRLTLSLPPILSRGRDRFRVSLLGLLVLAGLGVAGITLLFVGLGPTRSVAAVAGVAVTFAMLEWPLLGLVLVILSGTCFQVLGSESITHLPTSLGKMFGMMAIGMWLLKWARDRVPWTYTPQLLALLAYVGAMLVVTVLVRPDEPAAENGFMRFLQVFVVFWLTANLAGTDRRALLIGCGALTAGLAICGIIGTLEHFVPSFAVESDDPSLRSGAVGAIIDHDSLEGVSLRRITGGLGDSNWLAATIAAVLPLNLFWWWLARSFTARLLVAAVAGLQLLALVLSYTRAGMIAVAAAALFLVWRRVISARLLVWAGVGMVLVGLVWLPPGFADRIFSVKYLEEGSTPMRKDLTGSALRFALERPLLGYGYGQFGVQFIARLNTDLSNRVGAWGFELARAIEEGRELVQDIGTHNTFLEIMVEYGLLGLVPFVAFIVCAFRDLRCSERWGNEEQRLLAICIAAGIVAFCVCGMFVHAKYLKVIWFLAGLAAAQRRAVLTASWPVEPRPQALPSVSAPGGSIAPSPG
jgi:hypothetical protein